MATRPNIEGGASAPSNIVRLPTAAPRKVDNFRYAEQRRAVVEARKDCRWQTNMTPLEREKRAEARELGLERTPALLLAMALLKASDGAARGKVLQEVGRCFLALPDDEATQQAFDIAQRISREPA